MYIFGEDTCRSREYLAQVVAQFKKQRDPQGYNVAWLNAVKESAGKIFGELSAAPFLAERRMVILENILSNPDRDLLEGLIEKISAQGGSGLGGKAGQTFPETTAVIFWQGEKGGKIKEVKILQELLAKEKYAKEFKQLVGSELASWVTKELQNRQAKIGTAALNYLCANSGGDTWLLRSVIEQLSAYAGSREIGLEDIKLFLEVKADDNIFGLTDAVAAGNMRTAFKLMEDQRRLGKDEGYLFAMILRQFKIILQIKDCLDRNDGLTSDAVAGQLGMHPFVVKKSLAIAKKYNLSALTKIYDTLLQIDINTKTGRGDQGAMIDLFVAKAGVV